MHIIPLLVPIVCGCSSSADEPDIVPAPSPASDAFSLSVDVKVEDIKDSGSRGLEWGDDYSPDDPGNDMDNTIKRLDLYFTPMAGDDSFEPIHLNIRDTYPLEGGYRYVVDIPTGSPFVRLQSDGSYMAYGRIVAVANDPDGAPLDPLADYLFDIDDIFAQKAIPMWGAATASGILLTENKVSQGPVIPLLRSVAKIVIDFANPYSADKKERFRTLSVEVADGQQYNLKGNFLPKDAAGATSTDNLDIEGCFNEYAGSQTPAIQFFNLYTTDDGPQSPNAKKDFSNAWVDGASTVWAYLPEVSLNPDGKPRQLDIKARYKLEMWGDSGFIGYGTEDFEFPIYLCEYKDGVPQFDQPYQKLVRNHVYQYRITVSSKDMDFNVSISSWNHEVVHINRYPE